MALSLGDGLNGPILHLVWRTLPMELVEVVLKCVPFQSLVRFRAVCKQFNYLITLPKFARECQRQQASKPMPVMVHSPTWLNSSSIELFNSEKNSWLTHPLPILEANLYPLELSVTSGGLLCFETRIFGKFVIYNPLTGAFRLVQSPSPPIDDDDDDVVIVDVRQYLSEGDFTGLVVDLQTGTFTLIHVIVTKNWRKTLFYDSADGYWRSGAPCPDIGCFNVSVLASNESIYSLIIDAITTEFSKLLKYDVRKDSWSEMSLPSFGDKDLEIIEHRRQVLLCFGASQFGRLVLNNDFQIELARTFYSVRGATTDHEETLVEEKVVFQGLYVQGNVESLFDGWIDKSGDLNTVGIGDVLCITRGSGRQYLDPRYPIRVLHFNCTTQKYSLLPACFTTKPKVHPGFDMEIKLLEPSLTVDL